MKIHALAIALAAGMSMPVVAFAALGGTVASVETDRVQMKATARVARAASNFTVHELTLGSGTTVREYVAANGSIFGVAWNGPTPPNLQQILGQYFSALSDTTAVKRISHTQMRVEKADLVVHASGHMRAFAGHAYLTSMLPQGVTAADIQ